MKFPILPFKVAVSAGVILAALLLYAILLPLLGGARDDANAEAESLGAQAAQLETNIRQLRDDHGFIVENAERFEALLASDRLIPHTRRAAITRMQEARSQHYLSTITYGFETVSDQSLTAASSQPRSGTYRVSAEVLELTLGAPLDSSILGYIADISDRFPGSLVFQSMEVKRAPQVTTDALNRLSRGEESGLVSGRAVLLWRTALENKETPAENKRR